ncbi:MAG: fused MFS/spermidine synthase [Pseudomonadota bacterium]
MNLIVYWLAFSGGFAIMSMELLGGRLLAPYFGSSIYVWGSIITVFMLALSIGYLLGGRATLARVSVRRLGSIFIAGAVLMLPLLLANDAVMGWIFDRLTDPRLGSLVACMSLFFIPTLVLGMISPYAVRLLVQHRDESGAVAGRLYFVSTLGSALGTLATSFYLVLWFEMNTLFIILAALLASSGALGLVLGNRLESQA